MAKRSRAGAGGGDTPRYARPSRQAARQRRSGTPDLAALFAGAGWLGLFFVLAAGGIPWLLAWVLGATVATLGAFWWDKAQASAGGPRFRERDLLLFVALGGYLGGAVGMAVFRHKTLHRTFWLVLVLAAAGWTALLAGALWPR